jgi:hypothetical protein
MRTCRYGDTTQAPVIAYNNIPSFTCHRKDQMLHILQEKPLYLV